jgi:6-phosphogluconolactonase
VTTPEPLIEVHDDAATLATAVTGELVSRLADAQAAGSVPQIALTGGTIAHDIHREITRLAPDSGVDWSRVVFWWGDERFVAPDSPDRNAGQARAAFLDVLGVDPANVHEMPSTADAADVDAGATAYGDLLRRHGSGEFDIVMLGIGPDGHVASLFPGFPQLDADAIAVGVTGSPKPPPERISLTFAALNRARAVWFMVSGADKASPVAAAVGGADPHDIPAAGVAGREETVWFLDREAASQL